MCDARVDVRFEFVFHVAYPLPLSASFSFAFSFISRPIVTRSAEQQRSNRFMLSTIPDDLLTRHHLHLNCPDEVQSLANTRPPTLIIPLSSAAHNFVSSGKILAEAEFEWRDDYGYEQE